jgi:hypothetical protein
VVPHQPGAHPPGMTPGPLLMAPPLKLGPTLRVAITPLRMRPCGRQPLSSNSAALPIPAVFSIADSGFLPDRHCKICPINPAADALMNRYTLYRWTGVGWRVGQIVSRHTREIKRHQTPKVYSNFVVYYECDDTTAQHALCFDSCNDNEVQIRQSARGCSWIRLDTSILIPHPSLPPPTSQANRLGALTMPECRFNKSTAPSKIRHSVKSGCGNALQPSVLFDCGWVLFGKRDANGSAV